MCTVCIISFCFALDLTNTNVQSIGRADVGLRPIITVGSASETNEGTPEADFFQMGGIRFRRFIINTDYDDTPPMVRIVGWLLKRIGDLCLCDYILANNVLQCCFNFTGSDS